MRILFINRMAGTVMGGGENVALHFMDELTRRGHHIGLLTARPLFKSEIELSSQWVNYVMRIPFLRYVGSTLGLSPPFQFLFMRLDFLIFEFFCKMRLRKIIRQSTCDIAIITGLPWFGAYILKKYSIPTIVRLPGLPSPREKKYLPHVSMVVANGDAYRRTTSLALANIRYLPVGINRIFFEKIDERLLLQEKDKHDTHNHNILIFVGRLNEIKNIPFLIDVLNDVIKTVPNTLLFIIGEGDQKCAILKKIDRLNLKEYVRFIAPCYGEALARYYKFADVFVLASKYDNYPNVIMESLASGLPVVATNVGGIHLQIKDGENGYLIPQNDVQLFSQKVIHLLKNKELRNQMSKNAYLSVEGMTWESATDKLENILQETI